VLPAPDAAAAEHSERVLEYLRRRIRAAGGSIGFDEFMDAVLYAPGLGYYQAGQARFGPGGDFVTAPELTPVFGRCLARQVAELLGRLPRGARLLELGAGRGTLAAELIEALRRLGSAPAGYDIVELSADLRREQQRRLAPFAATLDLRWLERLPQEPWCGVVLANEVMDALPVVRFRKGAGGEVQELRVALAGEHPAWHAAPARSELAAAVTALEAGLPAPLSAGYESEVNLLLGPWLAALAAALASGALLLVDYGYTRREYYHPERGTGTLVCHYRHRVHDDPFVLVGLQDLSCSVDFSLVADTAAEGGLSLGGYATQAHFLIGCGLDEVLAELGGGDPQRAAMYAGQARQLVLPGEMGERFKVLALGKGMEIDALRGFAFADHRARL